MSASWNAMVEEVTRSRREREEWNRTLEQRIAGKTGELEKAHEHMLLVEKMASLGKLAAVVAHEVNNPLAGIQTYARLLKRQMEGKGEGAGGGETLKGLDLMELEAARCGGILRNLLLFSKTPGGRFAIENRCPRSSSDASCS